MTARERAKGVLQWTDLDWPDGTRETTPGHAERLVDLIECAGLVVVDRELHEALVQAVRAYQWDQEIQKAIQRGDIDWSDPWFGGDRAALGALDRAVEALAEKGE